MRYLSTVWMRHIVTIGAVDLAGIESIPRRDCLFGIYNFLGLFGNFRCNGCRCRCCGRLLRLLGLLQMWERLDEL